MEKEKHSFRKAAVTDIRAIQALVNEEADRNRMLPRSLHDLFETVRDFHLCVARGRVVGVCALHVTWEDLAEIRSLAVAGTYRGRGIGRALIRRCLDDARRLGVRRVFALTYHPEFFVGLGFAAVDKSELPHKVWAECIRCRHFPDCREEAVLRRL